MIFERLANASGEIPGAEFHRSLDVMRAEKNVDAPHGRSEDRRPTARVFCWLFNRFRFHSISTIPW